MTVKLELEDTKRRLIASCSVLDCLRAAFPKRLIEASIYAPNGSFYWFGNKGAVRMMRIDDPKVWVCDYGRGMPYMKVKRIVKRFAATP